MLFYRFILKYIWNPNYMATKMKYQLYFEIIYSKNFNYCSKIIKFFILNLLFQVPSLIFMLNLNFFIINIHLFMNLNYYFFPLIE